MKMTSECAKDDWDLLTHAPSRPRVCKIVFDFVRCHRDALGLPKGSTAWPYFFISNDLCEVFFGVLDVLMDHEQAVDEDEVRSFRLRAWAAFIESYDDLERGMGSLGQWHSIHRDDLLARFQICTESSLNHYCTVAEKVAVTVTPMLPVAATTMEL